MSDTFWEVDKEKKLILTKDDVLTLLREAKWRT